MPQENASCDVHRPVGPGNYRFSDFFKIDMPLTGLIGATAILLIPLIWPF